MTGHAREYVPAEPFTRWLNERLAAHAERLDGDVRGAIYALALECGWGSAAGGVRKLYRYRHQLREGSKGGRKQAFHTDEFPRVTVEEALFAAGVPFEDLYPEIAAAEDVLLEPEQWCAACFEQRSPIDGFCPFCDRLIGPRTGQRLMGERRAA